MPVDLLAFGELVTLVAILIGAGALAMLFAQGWVKWKTQNWIDEARSRNQAWKESERRRAA
jgi:hypothetical protein